MKRIISIALLATAALAAAPAPAQVKMTKAQMMFYTSEWKGDRFPDGRPKLSDSLLTRALESDAEAIAELQMR